MSTSSTSNSPGLGGGVNARGIDGDSAVSDGPIKSNLGKSAGVAYRPVESEMSILRAIRRNCRGCVTNTSNQSSSLLASARKRAVDVLDCVRAPCTENISALAEAIVFLITEVTFSVPV